MEFLDNVKLSTRDGEEYTGHENPYRSGRNPRWLPGFSFAYGDQPTFSFLVEFHDEIEVLNDKEKFYPVDPVLLQPPTTSSFHSATILTNTIACSHIFLRNKILLFPKWRQKPIRPILRCWERANLQTLEIHRKLTKIGTFFSVLIKRKRKFILEKKKKNWGG